MCDSGKGETFCEGSKKEQSARKISRCARNDNAGARGLLATRHLRLLIPAFQIGGEAATFLIPQSRFSGTPNPIHFPIVIPA